MTDAYVQVQTDGSGKKVQVFENTVGSQIVEAQAVVQVNPATGAAVSPALEGGNLATIAGKDFATQTTLALVKAKTDNLDAALSTLATQATLAQIKTDVDKIPASPSQEHVTAGSPHAVELSDGAAFYTGAKTGQLPAALVSGRVDVNLGADAVGLAKESGGNLATLIARTPALGAAATASSTPVNIANDQTVPISAASLPLPAGAATAARQDTGNVSLASIDGKAPALVSGRVPVDSGIIQAQIVVPLPSLSNGTQTPMQADLGGNVRVLDAELARQRGQFEESRLAHEQNALLGLRTRGSEERMAFMDRRGGVGQRGTVR